MMLVFLLFQKMDDIKNMIFWFYPDLRHYKLIEKAGEKYSFVNLLHRIASLFFTLLYRANRNIWKTEYCLLLLCTMLFFFISTDNYLIFGHCYTLDYDHTCNVICVMWLTRLCFLRFGNLWNKGFLLCNRACLYNKNDFHMVSISSKKWKDAHLLKK